ncbi:hypothetical protein ACFL6I_24275 [candidate division KSB1 bacterium]
MLDNILTNSSPTFGTFVEALLIGIVILIALHLLIRGFEKVSVALARRHFAKHGHVKYGRLEIRRNESDEIITSGYDRVLVQGEYMWNPGFYGNGQLPHTKTVPFEREATLDEQRRFRLVTEK